MQHVTLANGAEMPILGFGVYQVPQEQVQEAVETAFEAGYRSVDTAAGYRNEQGVGAAIRSSDLPREELFITTKLWVQDARGGKAEEHALRAFDASMDALGLDVLDLWLMHQPYGDVYGQWRAMQRVLEEGRVRAIGVSNFHQDRIIDLIRNTEVAPVVNQIETNPFHQRVDDQRFLAEHGVQIESWAPFAEGQHGLFTHPMLGQIAERHGKSIAQVVLRWLIQRGVVVIPKSVTPSRIRENLDVFGFELPDEDMQAIALLDRGQSVFFDHRDPEWAEKIGRRRL